MQIGLKNWLLAVLPRCLFCFQKFNITQWFNPVAECMLLAWGGLKQAQLTAQDKCAGQQDGVQWVCVGRNTPFKACVRLCLDAVTMAGGPKRQGLGLVV